jgi:hypothetical protein
MIDLAEKVARDVDFLPFFVHDEEKKVLQL